MQNNKLKVIVSAYACEPNKGSEPGVGWNWSKQIANFAETWVVTRANNRSAIEERLKQNPIKNLHLIYVDLPRCLRFWKRGLKGVRLYYYLWQIAALLKAFQYNKQIRFDLAHHVTFVNDWLPSMLSLLPIPFIWGPIGSNLPVPLNFLPNYKSKIREYLRTPIQKFFRCVDPFFHVTVSRAHQIISIDKHLEKKYPFKRLSDRRFLCCPAIGIDPSDFPLVQREYNKDASIKLLFVGQLIYIKGLHLALSAYANVLKRLNENNRLIFEVIGDGKEMIRLKSLAASLGINRQVTFLGNMKRNDVLQSMAKADIFIFPSFEGGGMVILEAMASGIPVICLDTGGPGDMVAEDCGIKIKPLTPKKTIIELANALFKLTNDAELRGKMGKAGRKRAVKYYTWDSKGTVIQNAYQSIKQEKTL